MLRPPGDATDLQIAICGSAGDGTIAAGDIFKRAMAKAGYRVIAFDLYPPEIRGFGKCIARARCTTEPAYSLKSHSDVLVSLNDDHALAHVGEVAPFGTLIYDDAPMAWLPEGAHISGHLGPAQLPYGVGMREMSERTTSSAKSRNLVALGFLAGLYRIPRDPFHEVIAAKFHTKPEQVTQANLVAFDAGYDAGKSELRLDMAALDRPPDRTEQADLVMMSGNAAITRGCLDAGLQTFFGYPITPATSILEMLAARLPANGGRVLQTEDEISAMAAATGAGFTGVRAATATSGPGLALMAELLGLASAAEVPVVVFASQRGGPSTGMPTKTEQSDLNLAVFGAAGDGQRIVLAPTNVEGCYRCAGKAFEMADRYQTPVIVLLDLYLSNRYEAVAPPASNPFEANSARAVSGRAGAEPYRRYALTADGISPRAVPGQEGYIHVITGLEHDEWGAPCDSPQSHDAMSHKRHEKLAAAVVHPEITITKRFGDAGAVDVGVLGWGSTFGEILEAMIEARKEGIRCSAMKVVMLSPLPVAPIRGFLDDCAEVLVPELNYEGQFANLVSGTLGRPVARLNRVPGTPMPVADILAAIRALASRSSGAKQPSPTRAVGAA